MTVKIKFRPRKRKIKTIKGKIIDEYKHFFLVATKHYTTCINKKCLKCRDVEVEK